MIHIFVTLRVSLTLFYRKFDRNMLLKDGEKISILLFLQVKNTET
ncbi:hypothetical protein SAMN02745161_2258 [Halodesulfovibrio marinisediminis DSM 17456]|uniref:Uncharacterized protein n=1 Tax=Halodesulfovibrio marinisediminis DSM 17456 TaxID=1121457 RepID=A0A1N6HKF3_9BACT|nr:hypothetical protein SAMN02745161_2258 [Halodesulfovibrio marinisediminis DSM 17456]